MNMKTTEIIEEQKWKKCRLSNRGSDAERNDDSWKDWKVKNELLQKLWKYKKAQVFPMKGRVQNKKVLEKTSNLFDKMKF